jgi:hypothetical protein
VHEFGAALGDASGARTGVRDKSGLSAADYAPEYGHQQLIPKLSR